MFDKISARNIVQRQLGIMATSGTAPSKDFSSETPSSLVVYRTFSPPGKEAVVVAVTFRIKGDDSVEIEGDIVKEEKGATFYQTAIMRVRNDDKSVLSTAKKIAEELSKHGAELRIALLAD